MEPSDRYRRSPHLPFVVDLDRHRAREAEQGSQAGNTPTTSVRRLISLRLSNRLVDHNVLPMHHRMIGERAMTAAAAAWLDFGSYRRASGEVSSCSRTCPASEGWASGPDRRCHHVQLRLR
jgi:hypothetical protein